MAKAFGGKRPQNLRHTLRRFGDYLGHHKRKLAPVSYTHLTLPTT